MRLVSARLKAHGAKRRGRLDIVYVLNVSISSPIWGLNRRSNRQVEEAQEESLKAAILFGSPAWTPFELLRAGWRCDRTCNPQRFQSDPA
jgi:hypothetical protein